MQLQPLWDIVHTSIFWPIQRLSDGQGARYTPSQPSYIRVFSKLVASDDTVDRAGLFRL